MKKVLLWVLFIFCFSVVAASAQTIGTPSPMTGPIGWGMNNLFYSNRIFNLMMANSMLEKGAKTGNRRGAVKPAAKTAAVDYTAFRESPGILLSKQLAGKGAAQNQRELEQMFAAFVGLYKQTAQKDGFPANDLAYAFEYFVVNNYQLYRDLINLPPEKDPRLKNARDGFERTTLLGEKQSLQVQMYQERAVYQQFKQLLASNPEIRKMTDAQKQEATELLAVMFGINYAGYMKGVSDGDEQLTEQARQMAKSGLEKLLGAPADKLKITGNGLEF